MQSRRDFLGTTIGTIIISGLPFIAEGTKVRELKSSRERLKELLKVWDWKESDLTQMKGFYLCENDTIKTTKLCEVIRTENSIHWIFEDWEAKQNILVKGIGICLPDGTILRTKSDSPIQMYKEDIYKANYLLTLPNL